MGRVRMITQVKGVINVRGINFSPPVKEEIKLSPPRFHLAFRETSLTVMPTKQGTQESSLVNVCKKMRSAAFPGSRAGKRAIFPQCRALMYSGISASFSHFCDLHYWMNLLISGYTKGPWRLQVDQRFHLLHATQMHKKKSSLCKPENYFKIS